MLASSQAWWGEGEAPAERSVIRCTPAGSLWEVRVVDSVGVVSLGTVELLVRPKIPLGHLLYLFERSGKFPRIDPHRGETDQGESFWTLVAGWYVMATEHLLRSELVRDYHTITASLPYAVGSLDLPATARSFYAGRLEITSHFDEFGFDTPLNRVIRAAARAVARNPRLSLDLRHRARRIATRMEGVGDIRHDDVRATPDRRTRNYADSFCLAVHVVKSMGRTLDAGDSASWTFLVRTPEMVEEGIRRVLQDEWSPARIRRERKRLLPAGFSVNPDLVIDAGRAVADVKYKLSGTTWDRGDVYEVVAFASAFLTQHAALIGFRGQSAPVLPAVPVGNIRVEQMSWPIGDGVEPEQGAESLRNQFRAWMAGVPLSVGPQVVLPDGEQAGLLGV